MAIGDVIASVFVGFVVTVMYDLAATAPSDTNNTSDNQTLPQAGSELGKGPDPDPPPATSISESQAYVIIGVCAAICCVAFVFDTAYYLNTMVLYDRYNTPNKDLLILLNEKEDVMDAKSLQDRVRQVLSMKPSEQQAEARLPRDQDRINTFLKGISDSSQTQVTEFVQGARDNGTLPIRKDNRLKLRDRPSTNLHISKIPDLYNNPMFLSAAPLPSQFADQWEAIWQEKVGVVVWVGRLITHESRTDAYIALREGQEVTHGNFRIKTLESGDLVYKFALYYVRVHRGREKREIVFVHAYEWLQDSVSWALERDIELIQCIKEEHARRIRRAGLRGVMFQCKLGTAGSATLLAVYLGFQFWLYGGRVNFYGVLKYVRRMRAMAFEQTGDPGHLYFVQVQVAYAVLYGVAKFCETRKISRYEAWIKEILGKAVNPVTNELSGKSRESVR